MKRDPYPRNGPSGEKTSDWKICEACEKKFYRAKSRPKSTWEKARFCSINCLAIGRRSKEARKALTTSVSTSEHHAICKAAEEQGLSLCAFIRTKLGLPETITGRKQCGPRKRAE